MSKDVGLLHLEKQKYILILLKCVKLKNSVKRVTSVEGQGQNRSRRESENGHLVMRQAGARQRKCVRKRETEKVTLMPTMPSLNNNRGPDPLHVY